MASDKKDFGTGFLYAEDLIRGGDFQPVTVVISEVHPPNTIKNAEQKLIDKPVIGFEKASRRLVLCKTNEAILKYVCGEQVGEGWIGKEVTLQARVVDSFGDQVTAIRVVPKSGMKIRKKLVERLGKKATLK